MSSRSRRSHSDTGSNDSGVIERVSTERMTIKPGELKAYRIRYKNKYFVMMSDWLRRSFKRQDAQKRLRALQREYPKGHFLLVQNPYRRGYFYVGKTRSNRPLSKRGATAQQRALYVYIGNKEK